MSNAVTAVEYSNIDDPYYKHAAAKGAQAMDYIKDMDPFDGLNALEVKSFLEPDIIKYHTLPWVESILIERADQERADPVVHKAYDILSNISAHYPRYWDDVLVILKGHRNDANLKQINDEEFIHRDDLTEFIASLEQMIEDRAKNNILHLHDPDLVTSFEIANGAGAPDLSKFNTLSMLKTYYVITPGGPLQAIVNFSNLSHEEKKSHLSAELQLSPEAAHPQYLYLNAQYNPDLAKDPIIEVLGYYATQRPPESKVSTEATEALYKLGKEFDDLKPVITVLLRQQLARPELKDQDKDIYQNWLYVLQGTAYAPSPAPAKPIAKDKSEAQAAVTESEMDVPIEGEAAPASKTTKPVANDDDIESGPTDEHSKIAHMTVREALPYLSEKGQGCEEYALDYTIPWAMLNINRAIEEQSYNSTTMRISKMLLSLAEAHPEIKEEIATIFEETLARKDIYPLVQMDIKGHLDKINGEPQAPGPDNSPP